VTLLSSLHRLDLRGQVCPYNLLLTKKELRRRKPGEHLEILLDHPASLATIPRWAQQQGHRLITSEKLTESEWLIILEKGGTTP